MPNIESAKRRVRVEAKAKVRNRDVKSELKTLARKFNEAVEAKNKETADVYFKDYVSALDKAVIKGTIHINNSSRKKAQASKALASLTA